MIIDFQKRPSLARLYDIFDAVTGEHLNPLPIVYADDHAGLLRMLVVDEDGEFATDDLGVAVASEAKRKIRITLKPECQGAYTLPRIAGVNKR